MCRQQQERRYLAIEHGVRRLHETCVAVQEDRAEKPDLLHSERVLRHRDTVADVEGVLDEQEDNTREDLRKAAADQPTETYWNVSTCLPPRSLQSIPRTSVLALVIKVATCASNMTAKIRMATTKYRDMKMLSNRPTALSRSRIECSMDNCSRWTSL